MEKLCQMCNYEDSACVESFRSGAPIIGVLPQTGLLTQLVVTHVFVGDFCFFLLPGLYETRQSEEQLSASEFEKQRVLSNRKVLKGLKQDVFADQLLEMTLADAKLKRMSQPRVVSEKDIMQFTLSPRFCVQQGASFAFSLLVCCSMPVCGFQVTKPLVSPS